jgi:SH3 domain-containing YSC84-like protein 1
MKFKSTFAAIAWAVGIGTAVAAISTSEVKRLNEAAEVVTALRAPSGDGIPATIWDKAECAVVIPGLKKAAFGIGGEFGRGVMSCRSGATWSAPLFMEMEKGSWGLQIGATEIDLVLLVMNKEGARKLLSNKVNLGADASVAGGPVGRSANASTDAQLHAEILSYSHSRGVFAGIDISGGVLKPDKDANADAYGADAKPDTIAFGTAKVPSEASVFVKALGGGPVGTSGVR